VLSDPKAWRAVSTLLLVVFIAGLLLGTPQWAWLALIGSGVTFAVELLLMARQR
jgi:diacylglycerol kinase